MDRWRQDDAGAIRDRGAPHIHFAGVTGRGLPSLAQVLAQRGALVTGAEPAPCPDVDQLRRLGVRIQVETGKLPRRCPRSARWIIQGAEPRLRRLSALSARRRGRIVWTPAQCLGALLCQRTGLAVAGGRSASVAAAMMGWTLTCAGRDPTVVLGTPAPQLGGWGRHGVGPHVVVEAIPGEDWSRLAPRQAVLLDDGDAAGGRTGALQALAESVPGGEGGLVLAQAGSLVAESAVRGLRGRVEWFGVDRGADWWAGDLREDRGAYRFRAFASGRFVVEVRLRAPGLRGVLGAIAAVAACARLDVPAVVIRQALEEFAGISREFESRGSFRGVTLIDDEGRDPAAVGEALGLARRRFGDRRLWAVLLAPSIPGPDALGRYTTALRIADEVVLVLAEATPGAASGLAEALSAAGRRPRRVASRDDAILELDRQLEPGDVLVTLGAGDVGTISDAFIRRLPRDRPGR